MKDVLNVRLNGPGPSGKSEELVVPVANAIPHLPTAISLTESSPPPPIKVENRSEYPDGLILTTNPSEGPLILVGKHRGGRQSLGGCTGNKGIQTTVHRN